MSDCPVLLNVLEEFLLLDTNIDSYIQKVKCSSDGIFLWLYVKQVHCIHIVEVQNEKKNQTNKLEKGPK